VAQAHEPKPEEPMSEAERAALEHLREYPFLKPLSEVVLGKLQPNLVERTYAAGETMLRAGEYSDAAFYLRSGIVEIRFAAAASPPAPREKGGHGVAKSAKPARSLAGFASHRSGVAADGTVIVADMPVDLSLNKNVLLEPGELFGELSALARYPLSSDVVAKSDVVCLAIRAPALRMLFKQKEVAAFKKDVDERYRTRTLGSHLRQVDLFAGLGDRAIERLRQTADLASFEPGAVIVEQGAKADAFYLVRGGNVKVMVRTGSTDLAVTYLRKGDYAGEIALLMDEVWPFSLQALEYVEVVKIPKDELQAAIRDHQPIEQRLWETAVQRLKERGVVSRNPMTSQYLQMAMDTGLIHGESVLLIDLNTCTRCDDCVRACADTHGGTPRFIREGARYQHWSVPVACYQCSDPVCLVGCPTGAITRALGTLEVTIDPQTCIGCRNCVKRCPWGNIIEVPFSSPTLKKDIELATKCDLCVGRSAGPACVQMCPHGAAVRISFKDLVKMQETLSA
jgi:CRP-like cAMP-binding protein/Fe-S-cluster-containing hydrogenase component 2